MTKGQIVLIVGGGFLLAGLSFLCLDCGMGQRIEVAAKVTDRRYEPPYSYVTMECMMHDPKDHHCTVHYPVTHHIPEHFNVKVSSDLGGGTFENRALYEAGIGARCRAAFSRGRWTGRIWGPLSCAETGGDW